jgi:hypothetical protein
MKRKARIFKDRTTDNLWHADLWWHAEWWVNGSRKCVSFQTWKSAQVYLAITLGI